MKASLFLLFFLCDLVLSGRNFYKILGVPKNASPDEIRQAYKKNAKKFHPDRNKDDPNSHEKFQDISDAYQVKLLKCHHLFYLIFCVGFE